MLGRMKKGVAGGKEEVVEKPKKKKVVEPVEIGTDKGLSTGHNPWVVPDLKSADYYTGTCEHMFKKVKKWFHAKDAEQWKRIGVLEGKRGCGKTMFLSMLAQRGSTRRDNEVKKDSVRIAAVYFFSTFEKFNMGLGRMLRSVADQMAATIEGFGELLTLAAVVFD